MSVLPQNDTICAIATPLGQGGIAVVRVSGPGSLAVARSVFTCREEIAPRRMILGSIREDGEVIDRVLLCYFAAPASFTGEDVAELHCHGGEVVARKVLALLIAGGARLALPGEFSKRAFLHGKMDLSQAEATCDLISAMSEKSARMAARQLTGALGEEIAALQETLTDSIAAFEAGIEYPEEDLEEAIAAAQLPALRGALETAQRLLATFRQGRMVREGISVALLGRPNVGKSSLLNALVGQERAIVTAVPGTTRDIVREYALIHGTPVVFLDTAGIREASDEVEQIGVERSRRAAQQADVPVFLLDGSAPLSAEDTALWREIASGGAPVIAVVSKADLPRALSEGELRALVGAAPLAVSAKTGEGLEALKEAIYAAAMRDPALLEGVVISSERHADALRRAAAALGDGIDTLGGAADLDCAAIDLRTAWEALGEITGRTVGEEIIDRIFSKFCLGK